MAASDKLTSALDRATRAIEKMTRKTGSAGKFQQFAEGSLGRGAGRRLADRALGGGLNAFAWRHRGLANMAGGLASLGVMGAQGAMALGQQYDASAANYAVTGNAQMGGNIQFRNMMTMMEHVPLYGASSGLQAAGQVLKRTEGRLGSLADMARQGIAISDDMIQREASVVIEQEKRAQNVEARIAGTLGSEANMRAAAPAFADKSELNTLIEIGRAIKELLPKAGGPG